MRGSSFDRDDERSRGFEARATTSSFFDWIRSGRNKKATGGKHFPKRRPEFQEPPLDRLALGLPTETSSKTFFKTTVPCRQPKHMGGVVIDVEPPIVIAPPILGVHELIQPRRPPPPQPNQLDYLHPRDVLRQAIEAWNLPEEIEQPNQLPANEEQQAPVNEEHQVPANDELFENFGFEADHENVNLGESSDDSDTEYYSPPPSPNPPTLTLRVSPRKNKGCPPTRYGDLVWGY